MSDPEPLDWDRLMRLGLGALRLAPETFWAMTPVEFLRALEGAGLAASAHDVLGRAGLERLMAAHPDAGPAPAHSDTGQETRP